MVVLGCVLSSELIPGSLENYYLWYCGIFGVPAVAEYEEKVRTAGAAQGAAVFAYSWLSPS